MDNIFKGLGTALITPFDASGQNIDFESLDALLQGQIDHGADFVVVMGTTGESPTVSWSEKMEVLRFTIDKCHGKTQVVFGLGGNNTHELAQQVQTLPPQVDGLLSVAPYYNKPSQSGLIQHYRYLASKTKLPIILYNVPGRTASNIAPQTVVELSKVDTIVAIKEASGNIDQIMEIIRTVPNGFDVLSGDDALTLPLVALGAVGLISVISNVYPQKTKELLVHALDDNLSSAREIHEQMLVAIRLLFEEGSPSGVKAWLKTTNKIPHDTVRLPLAPISDQLHKKISEELTLHAHWQSWA